MKKFIAFLLCFALLFSLAACGESGGEKQSEDGLTLALVVAGNFGDRSFYDSSNAGASKLEAEGVTVKRIECGNEKHTEQIYNAAEAADVVVLVGWEFFDVEAVAPEYPDTKFIWIDNATSAPVANVLNITYAQNEGSFLAGYAAAKVSETGIIGAMGGQDQDTINDFIVGYKQGALYANPDIKVEVIYSNDYDDPAIGKECALTLNEKGADVVFQIASKCGDGVFEAAQEEGFYAIGVDSDQKYIAPEVIICSMRKEVGESIYYAVKQYMEKGDDSGLFGTTWIADMATGYVGLAYGEEGSVQQISDEVKAEIEELSKKIIAGEITVDTTR
jgi:basic membrane protein A